MTVQRHLALSGAEWAHIINRRGQRLDAPDARFIFGLHGHGANALFAGVNVAWPLGLTVEALTQEGYIFVGLDAGGPNEWANDNAMAKILACINVLAPAPKKVALMGWSMGGLSAFNFVKRNPARALGALTWAAAVDLEYHWITGGAGIQAELNLAYGGNYQANKAGHDPSTEPAVYNALALTNPLRNVHSLDDPTAPWAEEASFYAAAPNVQSITVDGVGHFPFNTYPAADVVAFYNALEW